MVCTKRLHNCAVVYAHGCTIVYAHKITHSVGLYERFVCVMSDTAKVHKHSGLSLVYSSGTFTVCCVCTLFSVSLVI